MNSKNQWFSFFGALVLALFSFAVFFTLYFFLTFDLAGGESLEQIEQQRSFHLWGTVVLCLIFCSYAFTLQKRGDMNSSFGLVFVSMLFLMMVGINHCNSYNFYTAFNHDVWMSSGVKPFDMTATLVKEKSLIGLSREEVLKLLGSGSEEHENEQTRKNAIQYFVEDGWTLTVLFKNGLVETVELRMVGMMT